MPHLRRVTVPEGRRPASSSPAALAWPAAVCAVTAALMVLPVLESRLFFMRGDTAAQFAPTWWRLGDLVLDGRWPVWLEPSAWAGGNYAAEALFGIYNPISVPVWLTVRLLPDLMVGVWLVKTAVAVALALGTYLLAREYAAERWAAASVAVALPFSGFTLFWDAGSWAAGFIAFAYTPWVWLAFRRVLHGRLNPLWAFLLGALAVTQGNPYGTLAVVAVGLGVLAEGLATGEYAGARRLLLLGLCVGAVVPLVYLPLLANADLAVRSAGPLFSNSGKLRPTAGDLLHLSSPTFVPSVRAITGEMQVPATYLAWFVVPLLPWLRYGALRRRGRDMTGLAVVSGFYLLLTLGPAELWLFRWPLRLVEYTYLGLAVAFAVVLGDGLRRDHPVRRALLSGGLVGFTAFLTWAERPRFFADALPGVVVLVVLTGVLLGVHLLFARSAHPGSRLPAGVAVAAVCVAGTALVLATQLRVFGENASSRVWHFPTGVAALQDRFAGREGTVLQLADLKPLQRPGRHRELVASWDHYLAGTMPAVAGVEAVNNYTGMGFLPFTRALCMEYDGLTKACGYRRLWQPPEPGQPPMAELMELDTVVVQPRLTRGVTVPEGWSQTREGEVVVVRRETVERWPEGRLSWVSPGMEVGDAASDGPYRERATVESTGAGGQAVFAMLGWPGYTATLAGEEVEVSAGPTGLITVDLPAGASGELVVTYRPPGLTAGVGFAGAGLLGAVALGVLHRRRPADSGPPRPPRGLERHGGPE